MGWYPCCCVCVERVLIWSDDLDSVLGYSSAKQIYQNELGLVVHSLSEYSGDISDYMLVIWPEPSADTSWWPTIRDGLWAGRLVITTTNSNNPGTNGYVNSLSPYTGIGLGSDVSPPLTVRAAEIQEDDLTEGVTRLDYQNAASTSGGKVIARQSIIDGTKPIIARNREAIVDYVVSGSSIPLQSFTSLDLQRPWFQNLWFVDKVPCGHTPIFAAPLQGGMTFAFATASLLGVGELTNEETAALGGNVPGVTFTVGGVLTVVGTESQIAGTTTIDFTVTAEASGLTSCTGTADLTFTCIADVSGAGPLDGDTSLTFSTEAILTTQGSMGGQSDIAFTAPGILTGVLEMTGDTALQFVTQGVLASDSPLLTGSTTFSFFNVTGDLNGVLELTGNTSAQFTTSANLNSVLELTGSTSAQFTTSADLNGELDITGNTSAQFTTSAHLDAEQGLTGNTALQFTTIADVSGELEMTGNTSAQFSTSGTLTLDAPISGSTSLSFFNVTGDVNGELELTGNTSAQFTTSAAGGTSQPATISGSIDLFFWNVRGDLNGEQELTGNTALQFTTQGGGSLAGRLIGNSQMNFSTSGALVDIGGGGGFCEHCSGSFPTSKVVRLCGTISNSSCGICQTIQGDYELTSDTVSEQDCLLEYDDPSFPCGTLNMQLRFFASEISFDISIGSLSGSSQFKRTGLSAPYDCNTAVDGSYTLSFDSSSECTFSGMTVVVNPPPPACTHCSTGTTPETLTLIFGSGFANNNCEDCSLLGNTFVLTRDGPCDNACRYTYSGSSACGDVFIEVILGSTTITGTIEIDGQNHANLSASVSAPYNCSTQRNLTVSGIPGNMACDLTGITSATIEG